MSADKEPGEGEGALRVALGIKGDHVVLSIGDVDMRFTAVEADSLALDLMNFATELRNGGQVVHTEGGWKPL